MPNDQGASSVKTKKAKRPHSTIEKERDKTTLEKARAGATSSLPSGQERAGGTLATIVSRHTKNKREKLAIYNEIDRDYFCSEKPQNPLSFIDKDRQKVMINPGVPYVSTS